MFLCYFLVLDTFLDGGKPAFETVNEFLVVLCPLHEADQLLIGILRVGA